MHYHPELVNLDEAGDGNYKKFASQMLNEKVAWIPRNWQNVSQDTGIGNPKKQVPEKGRNTPKQSLQNMHCYLRNWYIKSFINDSSLKKTI